MCDNCKETTTPEELNELKCDKPDAEEIKSPKSLFGKLGFNLGYLVGPHTIITSMCTSDGPINPFTGKALYSR